MQIESKINDSIKEVIPVTGMSCASCVTSIESIIKSQIGVVDAAVNFASSSVMLEYSPLITDPETLKQVVQSVGYDFVIPNEQQDESVSIEEIQGKELVTLKQRTLRAIILSITLVTIGMFFMDIPYAKYIMWALATPILFVFGKQFFVNAWKQAMHKRANMDTLVALR